MSESDWRQAARLHGACYISFAEGSSLYRGMMISTEIRDGTPKTVLLKLAWCERFDGEEDWHSWDRKSICVPADTSLTFDTQSKKTHVVSDSMRVTLYPRTTLAHDMTHEQVAQDNKEHSAAA